MQQHSKTINFGKSVNPAATSVAYQKPYNKPSSSMPVSHDAKDHKTKQSLQTVPPPKTISLQEFNDDTASVTSSADSSAAKDKTIVFDTNASSKQKWQPYKKYNKDNSDDGDNGQAFEKFGPCVGKCGKDGGWRGCDRCHICNDCKVKDEFRLISQWNVLNKYKPDPKDPNHVGITTNELRYAQSYLGLRVFRIRKNPPNPQYPFTWLYRDFEIRRLMKNIKKGKVDISNNVEWTPEQRLEHNAKLERDGYYNFAKWKSYIDDIKK